MTAKTRTNQSGSVASFLVVGLVLIALVGGGIYLVKHRTTDNSTKVAKTSTLPSVSPSTAPKTTSVVNQNSSSPTKTTQPTASTPRPTPTPTSSTAPMPDTGPSDLMPSGIVAGILTASVIAFAQSRRATRRHLFNQ